MIDRRYQAQMTLLVRTLPYILAEDVFALKGGTAINLFHRPLPRLSVDIDLTFLPHMPREDSLRRISEGLERAADKVQRFIPDMKVFRRKQEGGTVALVIEGPDAVVKVEPNTVIRGAVFECAELYPNPVALKHLESGASIKAKTLSFADLFGGKICAGLDRQHPRDLYDIHGLLQGEGFTQGVRKAFLVYLISHDRPLRELLDPRPKDMRSLYENELEGMMRVKVSLPVLVKTLPDLVKQIRLTMTDDERRFLISFKEGHPRWEWLGIPGAERLPAPAWKLANIRKMGAEKHKKAIAELKHVLEA